MMNFLKKIEIREVGVGLLILILISAYLIQPLPVKFHPNLGDKFLVVIGYLFLISLFVERAIEMFLSAWRSEDADKKDLEIRHLNNKIESLGTSSTESMLKNLEKLEINRSKYSAKSRMYALWFGLIIGAFISLVGIRTLETIVISKDLIGLQKNLFVTVDVLLTASVLAGGSEAINKLMKVYNSFMLATVKKTK